MKNLLTLLLLLNASLFGVSFDCTKASSKVEKMICESQKLAFLDAELNWIYHSFIPTNKTLKREQRKWNLKKSQCQTADCLEMLYRNRIKERATCKSKPEIFQKSA